MSSIVSNITYYATCTFQLKTNPLSFVQEEILNSYLGLRNSNNYVFSGYPNRLRQTHLRHGSKQKNLLCFGVPCTRTKRCLSFVFKGVCYIVSRR